MFRRSFVINAHNGAIVVIAVRCLCSADGAAIWASSKSSTSIERSGGTYESCAHVEADVICCMDNRVGETDVEAIPEH